MAKITDVTKQKRGSRINLFIDGNFFCGLDELTFIKASLKIGDEISTEEIEELQLKSEEQSATDKAMAYASKYVKSKAGIKRYLKEKGYLPSLVEKIVAKLEYYGYINDENLARDFVSYYSKTRGINRLRADLMRMEIDKDIIDLVLQEIECQEDACKRVAEKYLRIHKNADKRKLYAHLTAKGFSYSDIRKIINEVEIGGEQWE